MVSPILLQELPHPSQRQTLAGLFNTFYILVSFRTVLVPDLRSPVSSAGVNLCRMVAFWHELRQELVVVADPLHCAGKLKPDLKPCRVRQN